MADFCIKLQFSITIWDCALQSGTWWQKAIFSCDFRASLVQYICIFGKRTYKKSSLLRICAGKFKNHCYDDDFSKSTISCTHRCGASWKVDIKPCVIPFQMSVHSKRLQLHNFLCHGNSLYLRLADLASAPWIFVLDSTTTVQRKQVDWRKDVINLSGVVLHFFSDLVSF